MYIAIFLVILLAFIILAFFEDDETHGHTWLLVVVAVVLTMYVAFRPAGVDQDYYSYYAYFKSPTSVSATLIEPTFKLINGLARLCGEPLILFSTYALLSVPLKIYSIKRLSPYWYLSILVWFTHLFILQDMTQIRVAVAAGIFLFSIPYLADGKKLKYTLLAIVAALFHYSALVFLPLLVFGNKPLTRFGKCALVVLPLLFYASPMVSVEIIEMIPIPVIQQKLQMYDELMIYEGGIWADINIFNLRAMVRLFAFFVLVWKYNFLAEKYPYMPILLKVFCYSICLYVGLSFLPPLAMRVEELVSIIDCILFPLLAVLVRPHWLGRLLVIIYALGVFAADILLYKLFNF